MLIWSGLGFLTVVIMVVCGISTRFILETVTGDVNAFEAGNTGIVITMLVSAVLNFGFYKFLTRKQECVVIDKKTGQEIVLVKNHSLFFIPVKWWTLIFVILSVLIGLQPYF